MKRDTPSCPLSEKQVDPIPEIIGTSAAICRTLDLIRKMAPTEESVLIQGESGTGKELIAWALHQASPRANGPFIAFNCAALQESLLQSELFGHEKGAFTSADRATPGLFKLASGGTLFIDEIGEMATGAQTTFLRVLEDRRVRRVGAETWVVMDVRVLAATNRDLAQEVAAGRFRADLFYRLNVLSIKTAPLRDRSEDIPLLAQHFLTLGPSGPQVMELAALHALLAHDWPGNVRELQNAIKRAKILAEGPEITVNDLPEEVTQHTRAALGGLAAVPSREESLDAADKQYIKWALDTQRWNQSQVARKLGISRHRLSRLMRKYGLSKTHPEV